jgi:tetratricopeptide (TPR) repeat protein
MQERALFLNKRVGFWIAVVLFAAILPAFAQNLRRAEDLYQQTDYAASLALLNKNTDDPATNFLIGRDYLMKGELKNATDFLLKATQERPNSSELMDWLGRAYGRRAETSTFVTAPAWASKARQAFERAVELDPKNSDALSDLFDYYLDAPGFLGGGYQKASAVADKTAAIDAPEAFHQRARLAQKRKEYSSAELQLRQAVAAAPQEVGHLVALARFLASQGRTEESDQVFRQAESVNPNAPSVWYARADILVKQKRDLDEASALLQKYMHAHLTPDDPPKQEALRLLRQTGAA